MKTCPNFKMTTDSHSECPVCKYDLTNEPYSERKSEKYVFNKYFLPYLLKNHKFALICVLVVLIGIIISMPRLNWLCLIAFLLSVMSLDESLFKNRNIHWQSWMYNEDYLEATYKIGLYGTGIGAVIVIVFSLVLKLLS